MEVQLDAATMPQTRRADGPAKPRNKKRVRPQLLIRADLDNRTNAAKFFDRLVVAVQNDLGGCDNLSAIERALIEAFCGATVTLNDLNAKLLLGQTIDIGQHTATVSAMVRVASRLGLQRRAREVGPSLQEYLTDLAAEKPAEGPDDEPVIDVPATDEDAPANAVVALNDSLNGGDDE
ncbi:MAG: hypothetical protein ACLPXW_08405 [Xanthobacteraceae bacterium]